MLFTICIPTYNRANTIINTIQSLKKQTYLDFEVIIVDDGSIDETEEVIKKLDWDKIVYCKKKNGGKHTALNVGIEKAKGELFLVLDSDDVLVPNALSSMASIWENISNNKTICGIMGRCSENGKLIGERFINAPCMLSYLDFHFGKKAGKYKDCCECIRTSIMKKYRWPESIHTHFVPEAYVMDQIGVNYLLYCVNEIYEEKEYLADGITNNVIIHRNKNCVGYLYDIVSKIDDIMPITNQIRFKYKVALWWNYWNLVSYDIDNKGPRVRKVSILGKMTKLLIPMINAIKYGRR